MEPEVEAAGHEDVAEMTEMILCHPLVAVLVVVAVGALIVLYTDYKYALRNSNAFGRKAQLQEADSAGSLVTPNHPQVALQHFQPLSVHH